MRTVPLFPEIRPYLEAAFELASPGAEFVINRYREPNTNLRTQLEKIIKRASVKPWPKLFHNLRASCETDLAKIHPIKAVCDWIGNSVTVAQRHYLQTTEAEFDKAAGVEAAHNPAQHTAVLPRIESHERSPGKEKHWVPSVSPRGRVGDEGLEPNVSTHNPDNGLRQPAFSSDAESDVISDVALVMETPATSMIDAFTTALMMIAALPLSDADKAEVVRRLLTEAGR